MIEFLGVIEAIQDKPLGQDYCGRHHRAGQRSPSRLIDSGNGADPPGMKLLLVKKRRASGCSEAPLESF